MAEPNVELHRRFIEAYNARDLEALIASADPSVEFHSAFANVAGTVYHGHDGIREFFVGLESAWGEIRLEPEAYFDLGESTLAVGVLHGRGALTGAEVAMPITSLLTWRNGLMVYAKSYVRREDALRELGISQDELEPIAP
jgi:ketosteroid isomerase-like protein